MAFEYFALLLNCSSCTLFDCLSVSMLMLSLMSFFLTLEFVFTGSALKSLEVVIYLPFSCMSMS